MTQFFLGKFEAAPVILAPVFLLLNGFVGDGRIITRTDTTTTLLNLELDVHASSFREFDSASIVVASANEKVEVNGEDLEGIWSG